MNDWISPDLLRAMEWLGATALVYLILSRVIRPLVPPFVAFELASTPTHAKRVRMAWQDEKHIGRAFLAVGLETVLIPLYVTTAWKLAVAVMDGDHPVVRALNFTVVVAVWFVGFAHFAENIGLVVTLVIGARNLVVFVTRVLGWIKYTIMALTVVWMIFEAEVYLYVWLGKERAVNTLAWLIAATAVIGFLVARQLTMLSREHPSLLALQFAPSRLAAKDILERWGRKGRKTAERALLLESGLAVLYGVTLAALCERVRIGGPFLSRAAVYLAWVMLTAAACHLAQNVGAYVALRRHAMGWWAGTMRRLGHIRLLLLGLVITYFICLLIRLEWYALVWAGDKIKQLGPGRLPWS